MVMIYSIVHRTVASSTIGSNSGSKHALKTNAFCVNNHMYFCLAVNALQCQSESENYPVASKVKYIRVLNAECEKPAACFLL